MNIFYADDDAEDREIFWEVIQEIDPDIKVVLSQDGEEALEILRTQPNLPDLIFLDINMPKMNGMECLSKLKSDVRLKSIPVIIYSTTSDSREVNKLIMLGAEGYIPKAGSVEQLKQSLQDVLTRRHLISHQ